MNCAITKGILLERWCYVRIALLEKDTHHRLRIKHIIEAEYNLATQIHWARRLMSTAEREKLLCNENWGSRKGRSALDVAMVKKIHYNSLP